MERLTHDADFGLEDWEEILYSVKSDPYGAYNILDIAECVGENEFDEILKSISLRLRDYEDIGLEPEEISAKIEACNIYKSLGLTPDQIQWLKLKEDNDGWIPVEKELPPNAKQKGAFCPKYQIMTKYGITEGWYNPDYESWFCLFWFMENKFTKGYIDFERGDVPKVVQIEKGIDLVLAWRPLPEPYKPERGEKK